MAEAPAKRLKTSPPSTSPPLIGTHNGHFHADEALAVYLLRTLPAYSGSPLVRTRDPALLATCHTVVDVGGEYVPDRHRYDHHQREFSHTFPGHGTKLSSAGLVWLHFGREVIAKRTGLASDHSDTHTLWEKLYTDFVEAVDANDNGINPYDKSTGIKPSFKTNGFTLASLVGDLNHASIQGDDPDMLTVAKAELPDPSAPQAEEDTRFLSASALMGRALLRKISGLHGDWLPARAVVAKAYADRRTDCHSSGAIMALAGGVPWKEHLYALEEEHEQQDVSMGADRPQKVFYVLYAEGSDADSRWRVQAVPVSGDSFESRRPLREEWRGLRDDELSEKSGIKGCVFAHASGFIGGNLTKEGALEMAVKSLAE